MKTVILAGGLGTRLREETEYRPKPMVEIGGRPVLWHLMRWYAHHGLSDFVVCTGYKGEVIKDYFLNFHARNSDVTVQLGDQEAVQYHGAHEPNDWTVTVAFTGEKTLTGGRIHRAAKYFPGEQFLCTYGDGLADVNLAALLEFHAAHGRLATVTAVRPPNRFGILDVSGEAQVTDFREKPQSAGWVNAGFFVFEPGVLDYLDPECTLEREPLRRLVQDGQLMAYRHEGFFQPMDTLREVVMLNELWTSGAAPWQVPGRDVA